MWALLSRVAGSHSGGIHCASKLCSSRLLALRLSPSSSIDSLRRLRYPLCRLYASNPPNPTPTPKSGSGNSQPPPEPLGHKKDHDLRSLGNSKTNDNIKLSKKTKSPSSSNKAEDDTPEDRKHLNPHTHTQNSEFDEVENRFNNGIGRFLGIRIKVGKSDPSHGQSDSQKNNFKLTGDSDQQQQSTENDQKVHENKSSSSFPRQNPDDDFNSNENRSRGGPEIRHYRIKLSSIIWGVSTIALLIYINANSGGDFRVIDWHDFCSNLLERGFVECIVIVNNEFACIYPRKDSPLFIENPYLLNTGFHYRMRIGNSTMFEQRLEQVQRDLGIDMRDRVPIFYEQRPGIVSMLMFALQSLPMLLFSYIAYRSIVGKGSQGFGNLFNITKSRARRFNFDQNVKVTFKDVAGIEEAKEEIMEFVKFLKTPAQFERLGAKIPRGAILSGPPGTGKTLLAKATAGEAGVPFYSVAGSEFLEMFVGVGASRVRDLFATARSNAPCIIFIDEIDAIGKKRRGNNFGGHDEREATLNQILVEMDGFNSNDQIVVLAGTNRADVLDPALLRPGRFDRQITVDSPDVVGRSQIFSVHAKPLRMNPSLDFKKLFRKLATLTPGFSGADIRNVCNEAALIAAREECAVVESKHFDLAIDRVVAGLEKKSKVLTPQERKIIAYHEAGHAVAGWFLEHADSLIKVSIVPRGSSALGYAHYLPRDLSLHSREYIEDKLCMMLAGRASEQIFVHSISTGAHNDLGKATKMVYAMLTQFGMNSDIGMLSFPTNESDSSTMGVGRPFSENMACKVDKMAKEMIDTSYKRALALLETHRDKVEALKEAVLEKSVIEREDLLRILGPRPFKDLQNFEDYIEGKTNPDGTPITVSDTEKTQVNDGIDFCPQQLEENVKEKDKNKNENKNKNKNRKMNDDNNDDDDGDGDGGSREDYLARKHRGSGLQPEVDPAILPYAQSGDNEIKADKENIAVDTREPK